MRKEVDSMKQGPCYNCEERAAGCHSTCEKYISFKAEREAENAQRNKERRGYQGCVSIGRRNGGG